MDQRTEFYAVSSAAENRTMVGRDGSGSKKIKVTHSSNGGHSSLHLIEARRFLPSVVQTDELSPTN